MKVMSPTVLNNGGISRRLYRKPLVYVAAVLMSNLYEKLSVAVYCFNIVCIISFVNIVVTFSDSPLNNHCKPHPQHLN